MKFIALNQIVVMIADGIETWCWFNESQQLCTEEGPTILINQLTKDWEWNEAINEVLS